MSTRVRDQQGSITPLILGFAVLALIGTAVVIDSSAAFIHRQGLNSVADGAALHGADAGGQAVHTLGVPESRLPQVEVQVERAVQSYLVLSGATQSHPGIRASTTVDGRTHTVRVRISAPVDLPLNFPGSPRQVVIVAEGAAVVQVRR